MSRPLSVEFEWDEVKRRANIEKHGLDFGVAEMLLDGRAQVSSPSPRDEEMRFATTAEFEGRLYTVIWTERGESVRVISLRRARDAEERTYRAVHG